LLGLALTPACVTAAPVEIQGAERFSQTCQNEPPVLSEADVRALVEAMPSAEQRERDFWGPRDLLHRACTQEERARANGLMGLIGRNNDAAAVTR
jgi:hypothetical protein